MTWTQTYTETKFAFDDIQPENVHIADIAHALSLLCRFNGHTQEFYSVAQHSVHVASLVDHGDRMPALLHDAAEAYIGDMPRPLKQMMPEFNDMEYEIMAAVRKRFGFNLNVAREKSIKIADNIALATEARDLMSGACIWAKDLGTPDLQRIMPLSPMDAKKQFIDTFDNIRRATCN